MKKLIVALLMAGLFTFTLGCGGTPTSGKGTGSGAAKPSSTESTEKK